MLFEFIIHVILTSEYYNALVYDINLTSKMKDIHRMRKIGLPICHQSYQIGYL